MAARVRRPAHHRLRHLHLRSAQAAERLQLDLGRLGLQHRPGLAGDPGVLACPTLERAAAAWLTLGLGIVFITAGNLVYTFHDQNLHPIPDPAPSDAVYLVAYAAFIIGVAILTQSSFGPVHASVRLDGAIAGLAIGALAGMAWFEPLLHMTGRPLEIAVNMAYPLCDLVLIVLLVAGLAPNRYRTDRATILLMVGIAWFVIGDVITLDRIAAGTYVPGTPLDETWLIGLFFIAAGGRARPQALG